MAKVIQLEGEVGGAGSVLRAELRGQNQSSRFISVVGQKKGRDNLIRSTDRSVVNSHNIGANQSVGHALRESTAPVAMQTRDVSTQPVITVFEFQTKTGILPGTFGRSELKDFREGVGGNIQLRVVLIRDITGSEGAFTSSIQQQLDIGRPCIHGEIIHGLIKGSMRGPLDLV
jgi:hypothetical protein